MNCRDCRHPESEHYEGECGFPLVSDPRDQSHLCSCRTYVPSSGLEKTTKSVTIVIEVTTTFEIEDVAKAVSGYVKGEHFRNGISNALREELGTGFDLGHGSTVEVEEQK